MEQAHATRPLPAPIPVPFPAQAPAPLPAPAPTFTIGLPCILKLVLVNAATDIVLRDVFMSLQTVVSSNRVKGSSESVQ
jgi:hypothetical protein